MQILFTFNVGACVLFVFFGHISPNHVVHTFGYSAPFQIDCIRVHQNANSLTFNLIKLKIFSTWRLSFCREERTWINVLSNDKEAEDIPRENINNLNILHFSPLTKDASFWHEFSKRRARAKRWEISFLCEKQESWNVTLMSRIL